MKTVSKFFVAVCLVVPMVTSGCGGRSDSVVESDEAASVVDAQRSLAEEEGEAGRGNL